MSNKSKPIVRKERGRRSLHEVFGVIIQAGTDPESGKPQLTIETTEQQLRDLTISPYGKQCRVEVLEIIPAQMTPNND